MPCYGYRSDQTNENNEKDIEKNDQKTPYRSRRKRLMVMMTAHHQLKDISQGNPNQHEPKLMPLNDQRETKLINMKRETGKVLLPLMSIRMMVLDLTSKHMMVPCCW